MQPEHVRTLHRNRNPLQFMLCFKAFPELGLGQWGDADWPWLFIYRQDIKVQVWVFFRSHCGRYSDCLSCPFTLL